MENQNQSMETITETFFIEETKELITDSNKLIEWGELVAELNLASQVDLAKPEKSPIPFMFMKNSIKNVTTELCPTEVEVDKYDKTPIPLEVLRLIALSKKEGYFQKVVIKYDESDPDPFCIGVVGHFGQSSWGAGRDERLDDKQFNSNQEAKEAGCKNINFYESNRYLIARWGDMKKSIEELIDMAKKRYVNRKGAEMRKKIKEAQRILDDIETNAIEQFDTGLSVSDHVF